MRHFLKTMLSILYTYFVLLGISNIAMASDTSLHKRVHNVFMCTRSSQINLRNGPGKLYVITGEVRLANAPLFVMQEVEDWYHIKTKDGQDGWVMSSLLKTKSSCKSYILGPFALRKLPRQSSGLLYQSNHDILAKVIYCNKAWCRVRIGKASGWLPSANVWGIY